MVGTRLVRTGHTWSNGPPYDEVGFGVTFNDVTKDDVFYTTTSRFVVCLGPFSRERQDLWLPKDDLQDSSFPMSL